jgi:hypothetical protein
MLRLQVLVTCNLLSIVVVYAFHSGLGMLLQHNREFVHLND